MSRLKNLSGRAWVLAGALMSLTLVLAFPAGAAAASPTPGLVSVGCSPGSFSTITDAVNAVAPHGTVRVCAGDYAEDVVVTKAVTIIGSGPSTVVDAAGQTNSPLYPSIGGNAFTVLSPFVTIRNLSVTGASGDGILVLGDHATVSAVTASGNTSNGINVDGSSWSNVVGNTVTGNEGGGIELANDPDAAGISLPGVTGTADYDQVGWNRVVDNDGACGIYLVDHAGSTSGVDLADGIHSNIVIGNTVEDNALEGYGSGVLLASEVPGGAVFDNMVVDNTINGNALPGITLHSHLPGEDLNGNILLANDIGTNNVNYQQPDIGNATAGVFLGSIDPLSIVVSGNFIHNDSYGIFTAGPVDVIGLPSNRYENVTSDFTHNATYSGD